MGSRDDERHARCAWPDRQERNLSSRLYRDDTKFLPLQGEGKDGDGFA
jgi:hypothetical protein